jgi:lipoprotein-releasing system ATP-binding protein
MIEIRDVCKKYNTKNVLNGINIDIQPNEIVAIQGPSGAGKTTLLKCIGLLENIDSGFIKINNVNPWEYTESTKALFRNKEIGFIFQFHNLLPEFSSIENILLPSLISGKNMSEDQIYAEELMGILDILHIKNKKPNELSGGEQQRVAIARALINRPKIILADEPSGNLDSKQSVDIFKLFHKLRNVLSCIFLIVTHNNTLANMCDRSIIIQDGKIKT